ncbi:uncharacterized protein LOC128217918 isoform X2 [Mya arenaria]|uniref:uncharacterized protein LOC128217918 isoform X2 n=1 Tax=Mya arenaria TaxID=6604 RepID=UPI0022E23FB6|nr:uncharacterized protein LOC128217918 isoform X2 [Mya arenaria]
MALHLSDLYRASTTEKVLDLEKDLKKELEELRQEIDESDIVTDSPSKALSSVPLPRDAMFYREERKLVVDRSLEVSEAQSLVIQAEVMREEMNNAESMEYTPESLPLLLHQYFTTRIHHIVQCKYLHLLRWKRFCQNTATMETLHPIYQKRLSDILMEYNDCVQRANRLSVSRETYMCKKDYALGVLEMEDLLIYLRWLICNLHSTKRFNQYLRVIQWMHVLHKNEVAPPKEDLDEEESSSVAKMASRYNDDVTGILQRPKSGVSRPSSGISPRSQTPLPQPPAINPTLLSTNPLPSASLAYAAAASGGGIATDEDSLGLPLNVVDFKSLKPHLAFLLNVYGINFNLDGIREGNSADEMEMFGAVNRKFKHIFARQETMKTFKTYDRMEIGQENWGIDSPTHALKQESNWLPYVKMRAELNASQEKMWTQLRQISNTDEILRMQAHFIHVSDPEHVQEIYQEHATVVRNPVTVRPVKVTTNHDTNNMNTLQVWRKIYCKPELFNEGEEEDERLDKGDFDERDIENVNLSNNRRSGSARKRRDSYDYINTVQMLGLDEGEQNPSDQSSVQGAYLSFLYLRHLRIKDLQRSCLSMFNYFRSLERTLTINDAGLTQDDTEFKQVSPQDHRLGTETDGTVGGGGGLASHAYLHNTPADFKVSEAEFIEMADEDNHDDFYTIEDGRTHVQDQRGYYIMYEAATTDLENLEKDLMLLATHYIEKDRNLRSVSKVKTMTESARTRQHTSMGPGDFNIPNYAHTEIDRFGIMMDLWNNETAFMECKRELIDCYMEAYHNVFDRDEKRALAQVIINLMYQRPRFDLTSEYFIKIYRAESVILRQHVNLVKGILDKQIEDMREYNQKVCRDGDKYGLPHRIVPKQPISVNHSKSALRNLFILEFHPSLAIASRIPQAMKFARQELMHIHKPDTILEALIMEKKMYEIALTEWTTMEPIGTSFSPQMQKDLFAEVFVEDPLFICEIAERFASEEPDDTAARGQMKTKNKIMMAKIGRVLEAVHVRQRLIDAAWETEILAKIYRQQAQEMGFDDFHMYMRFVQMEFAGFKEDAGKPPPTFITSVLEDESLVDRYTPGFLYLAIHELDEAHVGRFSFRSRDGIMEIVKPGGLETLQVVLKTQVVHKNAVTCAVQQAHACQPGKEQEFKSGRNSPTETKSEKSSLTQLTGMSSSTAGTALAAKMAEAGGLKKRSPEAFMSIQLEKTPSRDVMLNEFINKKNQMGTVLRNPDEMTKLKRSLISSFCNNFNRRLAQFSLRGQLLSYYNSILTLLDEFPQVRDTYFMLGESNEKKSNLDDIAGLTPDPRQMRKRPRRVLSPDGKHVLNIWFIPHHTETLIMFKTLNDEHCVLALTYCLIIVSALHDMLQYLCAHSRLGSSHARLGSRKMEFVSADWGGTEGVGAELREIQKQIDNLPHSTEPRSVSEFMNLRRDVMFLEFDTAVRHCMADTFLSTGNTQAYKSIISNYHHALPALSNVQRPSVFTTFMAVPEPLESRDLSAKEMFPIRAFYGRNGPYPTMFWQWHMIEYYIQLCLAGLKDVDRHVANGEILGVTLLMEDVLQTGYQDVSLLTDHAGNGEAEKGKERKARSGSVRNIEVKRNSSALGLTAKMPISGTSLSRTQEPIKAYRLLKFFLMLWKCLEYLKTDWGRRKLGIQGIDSMSQHREFCKVYKTEVLLPTLQSVARRLGQGEMYEGISLDTDPLVMPRGASEIEVRAKQLVKLLENHECHMITELRKKMAKELTLVLAERGRAEETALPTDLWKRPVMKESFTITKPHVTEAFYEKLMTQCEENDDSITFSRKHLNGCVAELARAVMGREKSNFDSYTMYYENLLRANHQNLYQKEQEVKQLKDQLKSLQQNIMVEVQCQLANQGHDLIMEITALRAKVAEMRQMSFDQQKEIRERVRQEYDELIQNLFSSTYALKNKFDEFRMELNDDVYEKISDTRREAFKAMSMVREKFGSSIEDSGAGNALSKSETLRELQHENHVLNSLLLKMKAMKTWRQNHNLVNNLKNTQELRNECDNNKKICESMRMEAEEQIILLRQQIVALRKALTDAQKEANDVKKLLDRELKEKLEKSHEAMQKARSQRQLEQAKQANIEKLLEELTDKENQLAILSEEKDRNMKQHSAYYDKIKKDVDTTRKRLQHERNMKLDAFQRVDDLQAVVYDYESCVSRTQSAFTPATPSTGKRSRVQSAQKSLPASRGTPSSGLFPPAIIWPNNRSITPDLGSLNNDPHSKKMQRPKTVGGRLRSRIADQLLNELEFDKRQTIVQLEELAIDGGKPIVNY